MTLEMNKVIGLTESHQECLRGLLVDPLSMANKMCTYYNGAQGFHDIYMYVATDITQKSICRMHAYRFHCPQNQATG